MAILVSISDKDFENIIDSLSQLADDYQDLIAEKAHALIRDTTPIRSGRARRGWNKRRSYGTGSVRVIENKVPYVIYLNEGHSRQAPKGYIEQQLEVAIVAANRQIEIDKRFK
jgi:hypothetical protein